MTAQPKLQEYVDDSLPIPRPFVGTGTIKLVIVGQDPTIVKFTSRRRITHALMVNQNGHLTSFLQRICAGLGVNLRQNAYATNLCKAFFCDPPTKVKDVDLIAETEVAWLPILRDELEQFPQAPVISLGEPLLQVLLRRSARRTMRWYWGYHPQWQDGRLGEFQLVDPSDSAIGRRVYPFIHVNSYRGVYKARCDEDLEFIRQYVKASESPSALGER